MLPAALFDFGTQRKNIPAIYLEFSDVTGSSDARRRFWIVVKSEFTTCKLSPEKIFLMN